jgi:hypothetical protein
MDYMYKFETLEPHVHEIHAKLCLNLISIKLVEFIKLWHKRPWHLIYHNNHLLISRKLVHKLPLFCSTNKTNYHVCLLWKAPMWEGHEKNASQTLNPLWLVYNDLYVRPFRSFVFLKSMVFHNIHKWLQQQKRCGFFQRKKMKCWTNSDTSKELWKQKLVLWSHVWRWIVVGSLPNRIQWILWKAYGIMKQLTQAIMPHKNGIVE